MNTLHNSGKGQEKLISYKDDLSKDEIIAFKNILELYVLPLLNLATIEGPQQELAQYGDPSGLMESRYVKVNVPEHPQYYYVLKRHEQFTQQEKNVLENVIKQIRALHVAADKISHSTLCGIVERAIAKQISEEHYDVIITILQIYAQWAAETHEGRRINHSIGLYCNNSTGTKHKFYNLRNSSALKSLGATPDTLLALDKYGSIIGLETISAKQNNYRKNKDVLSPIHMADIALWTNSNSKIAFRLCSNGEILIFKDKQLAYAKRRLYWLSFPHNTLIDQHFSDHHSNVQQQSKRAVYLTALDLAFSGKGGCLGVLQTDDPLSDAHTLVNESMLFSSDKPTDHVKFLSEIVGNDKFSAIPRRMRLSICSLDGAVLLDSYGTVLAIGAILRTNGNSFYGGGRSAAAQMLSQYGLGIKISDDGFIEVHHREASSVLFA